MAKKPVFKKTDGSDGPGRLFASKGEKEEDARQRLSEKHGYVIPKNTAFDKGTNSFVPEGRDAAFKKKASKEATPDTKKADDKPKKRGRPKKLDAT